MSVLAPEIPSSAQQVSLRSCDIEFQITVRAVSIRPSSEEHHKQPVWICVCSNRNLAKSFELRRILIYSEQKIAAQHYSDVEKYAAVAVAKD